MKEEQLAADRRRMPGMVRQELGLSAACADCCATADVTLIASDGAIADIWHDHGCPAAVGTVKYWRRGPRREYPTHITARTMKDVNQPQREIDSRQRLPGCGIRAAMIVNHAQPG